MNKKDIIRLLEKIALYLEIKGENNFRVSAYRKAAQALERDVRSLAEIETFSNIKGIGQGTKAVIEEYIQLGESSTLKELEAEVPATLLELLRVPGLGGKRINKLYQELNVVDLETLKNVCENGMLQQLPGFGKKTVENILAALNDLKARPERIAIPIMLELAEKIESQLDHIPSIIRFSRAGSLRRLKETLKDLDYIIATDDRNEVANALINLLDVKEIIAKGETKVSVVIADVYDVSVDFRLVSQAEFATTLHHFTGSKEHNILMRQIAKSRNEKINEYGVEVEETGKILTFNSEEDFFTHFNLPFIPPEIRVGKDELEMEDTLIHLVKQKDILGDLHMHTTWSDGGQSIAEMVEQAILRGYQYIAITDHSKFLQVANGLNEKRILAQITEINRLKDKYPQITILTGTEMDILPNGSLDFGDEILAQLDFVIASIHSSFNQSEDEIMQRLFTALDNPYVKMIAHPTGRIVGGREGYQVNLEQLIKKAVETNTILEINANPHRFDLAPKWAEAAVKEGALLAINTDAHNIKGLSHMDYGVSVAKQGYVPKASVINTWPVEKLLTFLQNNNN